MHGVQSHRYDAGEGPRLRGGCKIHVRCSEGTSCNAIKVLGPTNQNGVYPLAGAVVPFNAYCDYTTDAVAGTSYSAMFVGAPAGTPGTNLHLVTEETLCPPSWEIVVPRTHAHLDSLFTVATALGLASPWPGGAVPIFRASTSNGGDYTSCAMNSLEDPLKTCGTGTHITDWTPHSGTRWFLYAVAAAEPDGNYTANAFLDYTGTHDPNGIPIDDANATPTTGGSYMCAPANDKNAL